MFNNFTKGLHILEKYGRRFRKQAFEPYGLKRNDHRYLLTITKHPGISQEKIANHLLLDKGNVARQLATLEERGYITRQTSEKDKRIIELYPTEKGSLLADKIRKELATWDNYLCECLSSEEEEMMTKILNKLVEHAEEYPFEGDHHA